MCGEVKFVDLHTNLEETEALQSVVSRKSIGNYWTPKPVKVQSEPK